MFKRIIPLVFCVLPLFSCGNNPSKPEPTPDPPTPGTIIKIDNVSTGGNISLISEGFNAKKEQKFTFTIDHSNIKDIDDSDYSTATGSMLQFVKSPVDPENNGSEPSYIDFVDSEKSISIKYNGKVMKKFDGDLDDFIAADTDETRGKFVLGKFSWDDSQALLMNENMSSKDEIECTVTSAIEEKVVACYAVALSSRPTGHN